MTSPLELLPNTYRAFFSAFPSLTIAQKQLIRPVLNGEDIILQATTGAGKTEAVLAPATEKLMMDRDHFTIIYIVPTRALALDMNRRVKLIYKTLGLKSGIRTGDGKELRDATANLLIMTPESLDVLLGSQNQNNKYFLKHVRIIIIDEVHVFIHNDRGRQLSYLHRRLTMQSIGSLQTIALSATIDNSEDIMKLFNLKKPPFYYNKSVVKAMQPCWVHIQDEENEMPLLFDDLYHRWGCKKLLVFTNSRNKCERLFDILNQNGVFSKKVSIHYSNLSTQERKLVEKSFRDQKMGVCIATSTLELGIDIGDVDGVVLMGPPPSTMAFLQRIGRGNRRRQQNNFWGICYGQDAGLQLVRFLAFFELAKEHKVEKCFCLENYSVLFQQILSCLYAKKVLSKDSLKLLFKDKAEDLSSIFDHMLANNWLKLTKHSGIYDGGWRYFSSLKRRRIWSNFPPNYDEYEVILDHEKIAILPLSIVKQFDVGDIIKLTGKTLKILKINEKKTAFEVLVENSKQAASKELVWIGSGYPISFEVAQKMSIILQDNFTPQGLLSRTSRLLKNERQKIAGSVEQANGILIHQLENGMYRYETFLGSIANYTLCHIIRSQFASKLDNLNKLFVNFDEIGFECNKMISFKSLKIPYTAQLFLEWISFHLYLFKDARSWNAWMHQLPEKYQQKEIISHFYDPRILEYFYRYHSEPI